LRKTFTIRRKAKKQKSKSSLPELPKGGATVIDSPPVIKWKPDMAVVGIDLGTTSSAIAISDGRSTRLIPDSFGRTILPSLAVIRDDGQFFVGHEAAIEARKYSGKSLTIGSLKRTMDRQREFHFGNARTSPQLLTALILAELKIQAEMYLGEEVNRAVIAVPANFGFFQRQFTKEAALIAGWEVLRIYNEATAAVCALASKEDQTVVAADLGGGTFDVSVIGFGDGIYEVRSAGGDGRLGGEDFTDILIKIILKKAANDFDINSVRNDPITMRRIKDVAEESKLLLSGSESVEVKVPFIKTHRDKLENIVCTIRREEFETECKPLLDRIERVIEEVLHYYGHNKLGQPNIWLLGNASRMPAISRRLRAKYSVKPPGLSDLKASVALGAANLAAFLMGMDKNRLLLDVTPCALGIQTQDKDFETLIPKNSTVPTRITKTFTTTSNNQTTISVSILEEAERTSERHKVIGTLKMENIPARPAGNQKIEVVFDVDANNILHVSAKAEGFDATHKKVWGIFTKKNASTAGWDGQTVKVTCNNLALSNETLNQYHQVVQRWMQERRKRWPQAQD
jgi:molecular chaperone DnaK